MSARPAGGTLGAANPCEAASRDRLAAAHETKGDAMFEVTARLRVRDGELDGFKHQAAEMMRLTREKDTRTLRYDWFLSDDGTTCEVREGYVDADGLLEHAFNVATAREKLFRDHAYDHEMTIYGEPSPALAALMEKLAGHVSFNRFSLLQGLASDLAVGEVLTESRA
jgi:quinol monooxygenase YgiN